MSRAGLGGPGRPPRRAIPDQPAFDGMPTPPPSAGLDCGPCYDATLEAIDAAGEALATADAGMVALALMLAQGVDTAAANRRPRDVSIIGRELRETLTRLRLDPSARPAGGESDPFAAFLADLGAPSVGDASPA